jgi:hypothetical protein
VSLIVAVQWTVCPLWIMPVVIGVFGIMALRRRIFCGIVLIVVALLVGPGGVSILHP